MRQVIPNIYDTFTEEGRRCKDVKAKRKKLCFELYGWSRKHGGTHTIKSREFTNSRSH